MAYIIFLQLHLVWRPLGSFMCACAVTQSCPTLCHPMDFSPSGSSVHGIFQARILAIPFSRGSSQPRDWTCISCGFCIGMQILCHYATWEAPRSIRDAVNGIVSFFFMAA